MIFKKYILAVFIVFSLSFSYQPVSIYSKEKDSVIYILECNQDNFTNDFIKKNETKKFNLLISLSFQCMIFKKNINFFNSS